MEPIYVKRDFGEFPFSLFVGSSGRIFISLIMNQ